MAVNTSELVHGNSTTNKQLWKYVFILTPATDLEILYYNPYDYEHI